MVAAPSFCIDASSCIPDGCRLVIEIDFWAKNPGIGIFFGRLDKWGKKIRCYNGVVVEEEKQIVIMFQRSAKGDVVSFSKAEIFPRFDEGVVWVGGFDFLDRVVF